jgi:hypothetical protein
MPKPVAGGERTVRALLSRIHSEETADDEKQRGKLVRGEKPFWWARRDRTNAESSGGKTHLVCHREERRRFDKLKAPSLSWGDVAIHLTSSVDCRSRQASFAMTNFEFISRSAATQQSI